MPRQEAASAGTHSPESPRAISSPSERWDSVPHPPAQGSPDTQTGVNIQQIERLARTAGSSPTSMESRPLSRRQASNGTSPMPGPPCRTWSSEYDISNGGQPGGGGEYEVQEGFGWTNGVALMLLDRYGDRLSSGAQTALLAPQCLAAALLLSLLPQ
ncbi:trehalase-like isoform X3 [Bubalus bubalis]|uniref:trehalase-like isoform X3 n=1 Tax=Bubalus bubalis TaxID=89462 RepID=UPI001D1040D1|nr:trehalase-like isoform X3 [Bubalus bubalis]